MKQLLVVTDLDGTPLDEHYSFAAATEALRLLATHDIPLILCSSKTRAELEHFRSLLQNRHPFISENGGGVFIPGDYFPPRVYHRAPLALEIGSYRCFRLGAPYTLLRRALIKLRRSGLAVTGFGDLDLAQLCTLTGMTPEQADLARRRDFDEPFLFSGTIAEEEHLRNWVEREHLHLTRARFWHLLGDNDKGRAVELLLNCYRSRGDELLVIGLGDQPNDFPMLECVDIPVLIRQPGGGYATGCRASALQLSAGIGPAGWNEILLRLLPPLLPTASASSPAAQRSNRS